MAAALFICTWESPPTGRGRTGFLGAAAFFAGAFGLVALGAAARCPAREAASERSRSEVVRNADASRRWWPLIGPARSPARMLAPMKPRTPTASTKRPDRLAGRMAWRPGRMVCRPAGAGEVDENFSS